MSAASEPRLILNNADEIWIALKHRGKHILHQKSLPGNAEQKMQEAGAWYASQIPHWELALSRRLLCRRTAVYIGTLDQVPPDAAPFRPHSTTFRKLERSDCLTTGLHDPDTLEDLADFFDDSFYVHAWHDRAAPTQHRSVVVICSETDRKQLALVLCLLALASLLGATVIGTVAGIVCHDVAKGAEVSGCVAGSTLGTLAVVVAVLAWRLN